MDNVTHTLAAIAIAKTRVGRLSRMAFPAVVVAANFPDLDSLARYWGGAAAYFAHHRGITHSLPGVLLQAPLLATLFWAIEKVFFRRPTTGNNGPPVKPQTSWWGLCLAVTLGLATQPLFDWFNTYGLRPWLPFDDTWYYGDLTFIVDPWLWLLFGGAACLAGRRSRGGSVGYALIALLGALFLLGEPRLGFPSVPAALRGAWLLAVGLLALARWKGVGCGRPHTVVGIAATLATAYLFGLAWAGRAAWDRYGTQLVAQLSDGETLQRHMWSPEPANPLAWTLIAQTQQAVYRQPVDLIGGAGPVTRLKRNLEDPAVQAALATPDGQAWHRFARFPIAQVIQDSAGKRVLLRDARYPVEPPQRNWCGMIIDLSAGKAIPAASIAPRSD
jgi:membrane-bound metal-dependent hydrolase YbcI (DUF457 family)